MKPERILILLHVEADGSLARVSLEALTAAATLKQPGDSLVVGLVGADCQPAADQIAACSADAFFSVSGTDFAVSRYGTDVAAAEAISRAAEPTLVLAAATSRWSRVLPGLAQRIGGRIDTHVTGLERGQEQLTLRRWYYRQRMEAAIQRTTRTWCLLLEPGTWAAWEKAPGHAAVQQLAVSLPESCKRTTAIGFREPAAGAQTIRPDAALLFVAGAGWTKKQPDGQTHAADAERLILEFLRQSGASLGSTKSLVDLSGEGQAVLPFLTHLNQVGQTGSTPRHPKGLATCCHGEEPHTVGWRFISERRAISLDPNCGWARGKADVLYVADAFAVVQRLNELLASRATTGLRPGK